MNLTVLRPTGNGNHGVLQTGIARRSGRWKAKSDSYRQNPNEIVNTRRFYTKKKFGSCRSVPFAPRNTSSFIIRAKKSGGIASLVSPMTPDVLKTPVFSQLPELLVDMAKEEWGVNSYGSMKGLIRLRAEETSDNVEVSSCVDVDELSKIHLKEDVYVEGLNLRRFELMYPAVCHCEEVNTVNCEKRNAVLESRLNYHDMQIAQLGEEKLTMSDQISLMEGEMEEMRRSIQYLETCAAIVALNNSMEKCSDVRNFCYGSETSIGDGCDGVGLSVVPIDDVTS